MGWPQLEANLFCLVLLVGTDKSQVRRITTFDNSLYQNAHRHIQWLQSKISCKRFKYYVSVWSMTFWINQFLISRLLIIGCAYATPDVTPNIFIGPRESRREIGVK